jgi:hypothetical protein
MGSLAKDGNGMFGADENPKRAGERAIRARADDVGEGCKASLHFARIE